MDPQTNPSRPTNSPLQVAQTPPLEPNPDNKPPAESGLPVVGDGPVGAATSSRPAFTATPPPGTAAPGKVPKKGTSTQSTLQISEIRDGLVIMRDGSLRAAIMCQSINFDLMSEAERGAVESSYQGFLNSLYFPIQIFIRSRRVDLDKYIDKLVKIQSDQENILLSLLMEDYIAYVRYLIESSNIMDKQFYIIVPYSPTLTGKGGVSTGLNRLLSLFKPAKQQTIVINEANFNEYKTELTQQVQVVLNGLQQMNVQAVPLNTQELIELYYTVYNPQTAENERLGDVTQLEAPIVAKGQGEANQVLGGRT